MLFLWPASFVYFIIFGNDNVDAGFQSVRWHEALLAES